MSHPRERLKHTIGENATRGRRSAERVVDQAGEMIGDVRGYAEHILDQSRQGYRQVAARAGEGFRQAGEMVRENPGLTVSAAIGLGLVVGIMIGITLGSDRDWR